MKIQLLQHVPYEGPAAISGWALSRGTEIAVTRLYKEESLPEISETEALLIMGGPMGVGDTARYPWLTAEIDLIRRVMDKGAPVLGICLGAQLIARATGAEVSPMGYHEIGWWPVESQTESFRAFHWHADRFDLPSGAKTLYRNQACDQQGFNIGETVIGLQFHLEMDELAIHTMISNSREELVVTADDRWVQSEDKILSGSETGVSETQPRLYSLLDSLFGRI